VESRLKAGVITGRKHTESGHIQALGRVTGPIQGRKNVESGLLAALRTTEHQRAAAKKAGQKSVETGHMKLMQDKARLIRYTCACCGLITNPGGMGKHQKATGHTGIIKGEKA
jgi:hypothetical protein